MSPPVMGATFVSPAAILPPFCLRAPRYQVAWAASASHSKRQATRQSPPLTRRPPIRPSSARAPPSPTSGLKVTALTKTPTGFTATFNQPINPADLTIYGKGNTQQDVLLVGKNTNNGQPYPGTLIVDASKKLVTFNVSSNFLAASNPGGSAALPDDTYTVTLLSGMGNNGFQDVSGQGFDDGHGGHADYVGTFTTTYQARQDGSLGHPRFRARPQCIRRHHHACQSSQRSRQRRPHRHSDHDLQRRQSHERRLHADLQRQHSHRHRRHQRSVQRGGDVPDDEQCHEHRRHSLGGHFRVQRYAIRSGTQILGDITAYVPYSARSQYQVKDLLALGNITVNSGATVVPGNAVDVDAYFGDVNGDHHLDGLDKALIANVASTLNPGFSAFTLLDPAIIGDLSDDNAVTSNSTSLLSNYLLALPVPRFRTSQPADCRQSVHIAVSPPIRC